jgi:hypothetical protein
MSQRNKVKKTICTLVLMCLAAAGFALEMSLGVGAGLDLTSSDLHFTQTGSLIEDKEGQTPIDFKAFFDLTYIQVSAGYMFVHGGNGTVTMNGTSGTVSEPSLQASYLTFAVYAKYPFMFGPTRPPRTNFGKYPFVFGQTRVFPLLGIEYRVNLQYTDALGNDKSSYSGQAQSDLNQLWLEAGLGADFTVGNFFIRPELLIGFKPLSTTDNNALSTLQALGYTSTSLSYFTFNIYLLIGYEL